MGVEMNYSITANGQDVSILESIIQARQRELGETKRDAAIAMAIQVVRSLRANTKVANPDNMNITVKESSKYYVGWKSEDGHKRRCVRIGSSTGTKVSSNSIVNLLGRYEKGEVAKVFTVNDIVEGVKKRTRRYLILAKTEKDAVDYATKIHKKRVKKYAGLARFALTLAMMKTSTRNSPDEVSSIISNASKNTAYKNVDVTVYSTGFGEGTVDINIHDALNYATNALKGGEAFVQQAVQNACNSVVGYINRHMVKVGSFNEKLKVPFPKE